MKRVKSSLMICIILALLMACTSESIPAPTPTMLLSTEGEDYAVYAEVIAELGGGVIRQSTADLSWIARGGDLSRPLEYIPNAPGITSALKEDFVARNQVSVKLDKKHDLETDTFITDSQWHEVFGSDLQKGWERFHEQYGFTLITLSRPGFEAGFTQALTYAEFGRGALNGGGYFMMLVKANGRWTVKTKVGMWMS